MALETRKGRTYYYTSERVGGRVVKRYWGGGPAAPAMATLDRLAREERLDATAAVARRRKRNAKLRGWLEGVARAVGAALTTAGWHQHKREWRKKRGATMGQIATTGPLRWSGPELARDAGDLDKATADKAAKGDTSVVRAVDEFLRKPAAVALWGDIGRRLLQRWVRQYAGSCLTTERAMLAFAADLRDRLAGPNPDALAQLVAERVVIAWVAAAVVEHRYAALLDKLLTLHAQHKLFLAQVELMHRNLTSACRTLAKVRRAHLPDVVALVNVNPPTKDTVVRPAE